MEEKWKTVIEPRNKKINLNFKEIWAYRDLIGLFVKRDFTSKYKQTVLGPAWAVVQPVLTTVVFSIVFGNLAKLTTADVPGMNIQVPSFLFYMVGTMLWSYFSSTVSATSNTFIGNSSIMGKVYYPRMATPISTALANLISFFIQIALFWIIMLVCIIIGIANISMNFSILLFPAIVIQTIMLSTGVGIIISSVTTKYRDLAMLVGFGLQLWEYVTPIPYGLELIPQKYYFLYMINPVTPIVTTLRYAFFGDGFFDLKYYLISVLITIVIFVFGMVKFNQVEKTFMDTV